MTDKEAIKQLASLIINSQLFHQDEGDSWEKSDSCECSLGEMEYSKCLTAAHEENEGGLFNAGNKNR